MHECVETFQEWAFPSLNSAYEYARAPGGAIREITDAATGDPVLANKSIVYKGYSLKERTSRH